MAEKMLPAADETKINEAGKAYAATWGITNKGKGKFCRPVSPARRRRPRQAGNARLQRRVVQTGIERISRSSPPRKRPSLVAAQRR